MFEVKNQSKYLRDLKYISKLRSSPGFTMHGPCAQTVLFDENFTSGKVASLPTKIV